jgi:hypothetical protein
MGGLNAHTVLVENLEGKRSFEDTLKLDDNNKMDEMALNPSG